jgi:hypothetical protein
MQFFYQVTALASPNYRYACTGSWSTQCYGQSVSWSALLYAAQQRFGASDPRYVLFRDTGVAAGVNW